MEWDDYLKTDFNGGDLIWITDYRLTKGILDRPIRHLKPTPVKIVANKGNLPPNKRVYYSDWHFKQLNRKGEVIKSKIIAPFDNTGYRLYSGIALQVFLTEQEANDYYTLRCEELKNRAIEAKADVIKGYDSFILKMEELING